MIWYVRPPSGGQFGPASGDLMRTWLSEGRVSADSLVWREGWRDWQEAGKVFPKLRSNQLIDFLETTPVVTRRRDAGRTRPSTQGETTFRSQPDCAADRAEPVGYGPHRRFSGGPLSETVGVTLSRPAAIEGD